MNLILILPLLIILIASFCPSYSTEPGLWLYSCGHNGNYTANSTFATNFNTLLSTITTDIKLTHGGDHNYNLTLGGKPGSEGWVSVAALCRGDVTSSECHSCYSDAVRDIRLKCPNQKEAIGWYRICIFRYSNRPFWGIMESAPVLYAANPVSAADPVNFDEQVRVLIQGLVTKAVTGETEKWATGSISVTKSQRIYGILSCTVDVNSSDCFKCVKELTDYIPICCNGKIGASILSPSCDIRFDVYQFYRSGGNSISLTSSNLVTQDEDHSRRRRSLLKLIILIASPAVIAILLAAIGIRICHRRRKLVHFSNSEVEDFILAESLQFDLTTIKAATCHFSVDNKLGEGGFGQVYKGKLESGQEIAVKRLSIDSRQGILEFKNEVVLVAKLQHKNLVKLLGFCSKSNEKILVYEFLPNLSLNRFLFDRIKRTLLDWTTRFNIILGVARGLLYLHEDSRLKIIHRDLKTSNILLDNSMNPKISDFGLAKLFSIDQTQGDTKRIVGTYGYMAPEYATTGHFSVKSDVFSFGVVILEIVSGQRSDYFSRPQDEEALLHRAWRLWNEEKVLDLVDPSLENKYQVEEVTKCIHIGLLSIQENPAMRPKMSNIVSAINGDSIILPMPNAPQFFNNFTNLEDDNEESYLAATDEYITELHTR